MWEDYSIDEATVVQATSWSSMSTSPIAGGSALCWWIDEVADLGSNFGDTRSGIDRGHLTGSRG
jgi:hypothetical protein